MRKMQIGVVGSMADIKLDELVRNLAKKVGEEIAKNDALLVFGFEGDFESLSLIAAKGAEGAGGKTIAFVWGNDKQNLKELNSSQIVTGQNRGGGREFSLVLSCDAIICLGGGSGTLMEITFAYQKNIPIVVLENSGGWSKKLANKYLDERKKIKIIGAVDPKQAVQLAKDLINEREIKD